MCRKLLFLITLLTIYLQVKSQNIQIGLAFVKNYNSKTYMAHTQNFDAAQDARGVMYFANFSGILEFDGNKWKTILTNDGYRATAIENDYNGKIFVGALGDIGYLAANKNGLLQYNSLINNNFANPDSIGKITDIFVETHKDKNNLMLETKNILIDKQNQVFFITKKGIIKFENNKINIFYSDQDEILSSFLINDTLYIFQKNSGLRYFEQNKIKEIYKNDKIEAIFSVDFMINLTEDSILLGSGQAGVFLMHNNYITDYEIEAEKYLIANEITAAKKINNQYIAIGTARGGIIIINRTGQIIQITNKEYGLNSENVTNFFLSQSGILWATLYDGIAMLQVNSPLSFYNNKKGIKGEVIDIEKFNNTIYAATTDGLFYLKDNLFLKETHINASCNDLFIDKNEMYIATSDGIYKNTKNEYLKIYNSFTIAVHKNNEQIFAGQTEGLFSVNENRKIDNLDHEIWKIQQDKNGIIWLQTSLNSIIKYQNNTITQIDTTSGLPNIYANNINLLDNQILVATEKGIFQYDEIKEKFVISNLLNYKNLFPKFITVIATENNINKHLLQNFWISHIQKDKQQNIWLTQGDETAITLYKFADNQYTEYHTPFLPLADFKVKKIFCDTTNTVTWLGGTEEIIRYDANITVNYNANFNTILRKVKLKNDSVLFNGTFADEQDIPNNIQNSNFFYKIDFQHNTISFEFAAATYNINDNIKYKYRLEGFDSEWTEWTTENSKEYTNLPEGRYVFQVKAINIYQIEGSTASFEFIILTPIYRRWWAISIYIILAIILIYILVRWRLRILKREKELLEVIVKERTEEIENQKEELKAQSEELAYKNEELNKINLIVKAINSEINFESLLASILTKLKSMTKLDTAMAIINHKNMDIFKFKSVLGIDLSAVQNVTLSLQQAKTSFIHKANEVHNGIFVNNFVRTQNFDAQLSELKQPKSLLTIVVEINDKIEGFLLLYSTRHFEAFKDEDFSLLNNLREHINSAFIKAQILENLQITLNNLKETQDELIRKEKLASIGQLTKGIVDRLINPMNYINNFSQISKELAKEIREVMEESKKLDPDTKADIEDILAMLNTNLEKINNHGTSATRIIKGMEKLLKEKSNNFITTDINDLLISSYNKALADYKNENKTFNTKLEKIFQNENQILKTLPNELSEAFYYIFNNSFYALNQKLAENKNHTPIISIQTFMDNKNFVINIKDNGIGIVEKELVHVSEPFFTTKPTSHGTGLGLFMAQDIIKLHKAELKINSIHKQYTEVVVTFFLK